MCLNNNGIKIDRENKKIYLDKDEYIYVNELQPIKLQYQNNI